MRRTVRRNPARRRRAALLQDLQIELDAILARLGPGGGELLTVLAAAEAIEAQIDALLAETDHAMPQVA